MWPESPQDHPEQAVSGAEFGFARLPVEHGELMAQCQILQYEPGMGLETGEQGSQKRQNDIKHDKDSFIRRYSKINIFEGLRIFRHPQVRGKRLLA